MDASSTQDTARIVLAGLGATATMDLGMLVQRRLTGRPLGIELIGRWVGHGLRGRWRHASIAKAPPLRGEAALGWLSHYGVGVGFALLLAGACGPGWLRQPTLGPALALGLVTLAAPWLLMQPAMGAGIASRRTPTPGLNRLRSVANHLVFGLGLYLSARALLALEVAA